MKSLQKDAPHLRFAYSHMDGGWPDAERLRRVLAGCVLGRRIHADGRIEADRLEAQPRAGLAPGRLAQLLGPQDVVLVTGGARGIAARIVRHLLPLTAARFILIGRKPQREEWMATEGAGRVEYLMADVCSADAVRQLGLESRGITLFFHAAGMAKSRALAEVRPEEMAQILGSKVLGLHRVLAALDPAQVRGIVNFASISGYFGSDGQADYAAANAYLDGVTWGRVPVLSLGWSAWAEVGMATGQHTRMFLDAAGIEPIPVREGVAVFAEMLELFLGSGVPQSRNILVIAGLAPTFCLPHDPFLATFTALESGTGSAPVPAPAPVLVPSGLRTLAGTAVMILPLPAAAAHGESCLAALYTEAERAEMQGVAAGKRRQEKLGGKLAAKWLARDVLRHECQVDVAPAAVQVLAPAAPVQVRAPGVIRARTTSCESSSSRSATRAIGHVRPRVRGGSASMLNASAPCHPNCSGKSAPDPFWSKWRHPARHFPWRCRRWWSSPRRKPC